MALHHLGKPRVPGSGRVKGKPNKRSQLAADILTRLKFDGLVYMVEMLREPGISEQARVKLATELTSYQFPKRKYVEMAGESGGPLVVNVVRWGAK